MEKKQKKYSVLVAEDMKVVMEGMVAIIGTMPRVGNVSGVQNAQEVIDRVSQRGIDLVLLDVRMPGDLDGLDAGKHILKNHPGVKIIFITFYAEVDLLLTLLKTGAHGLLIKSDTDFEEIEQAIASVMDGETFYSESVHKMISQNMSRVDQLRPVQLSERDLSLIQYLDQGLTSAQIADQMSLSVFTIETIRKELLSKTQTKNTPELIQFTSRAGLL